MWEYLNQEQYDYQRPERGEIRQGVVIRKDSNEIILDVGVKLDAVITSADLEKLDPDELANIAVGDEIPVYILNPEDVDGRIHASISMAKSQEDWDEALRLMETGDIFESPVTGHNKGGLIVPFGRLRGFVPASQVMGLVQRTDSGSRVERLEQMMERKLKLKVIEVNQKRRRLILSERAAMKEWRAENKSRLLDELQPGDVRKGVVTNLMNFGAFVDLGGADGLVHVSEMAWHRVKHPKDVIEVGQEVDVYVLSIDRDEERIALSMKRLQSDPWTQASSKYNVGDVVEGEVTNLTDFGAFARIEAGIEGLIHISELSEDKVEHPREVVHRGQRMTLRIISIDSERQRIGLSLKRAPQPLPEEGDGMESDEEVGESDDSPMAFEETLPADDAAFEETLPEEPAFYSDEESTEETSVDAV
ncbi:MAG: S1 RNA-binding domain-containing protein [Ardenticatenales bacterium]|nr:S1 RNA-binding domain-containing protein [Ardenticatenales bacterium]